MKKKLTLVLIAVMALAVLTSLAMAKRGSGAWLGVYTQELDQRLAKSLELTVERGALVNEVVDDSPADLAGIREDDVITAVNGQAVADSEDLLDLIADLQPGDSASITIVRGDQTLDLAATLESRRRSRSDREFSWGWDAPRAPRAPRIPAVPNVPEIPDIDIYKYSDGDYGYIGVHLLDISRETAVALGAANGGALVNEVIEDSPAESAGVKPGDIIVSIDGENVRDPEDIQEIVHELDDGVVAKVGVVRDRKPVTLDVKVELRETNYRWGRHNRWFQYPHSFNREVEFDSEDFRSEMEELQDELEEMQKELKVIHDKLD